MLELQGDKQRKIQFFDSLGKGEFSNIEDFNFAGLGIEDKEIEVIFQAIESNKPKT